MNNAFYYQLLASIAQHNGKFNFPRFFKDLVKKGDIEDVGDLLNRIHEEVMSVGTQAGGDGDYFAFMAENGLLFSLYRSDFESFTRFSEAAEKGFESFRSDRGGRFSVEGMETFVNYLKNVALRLQRQITIEKVEAELDELDWEELDKHYIGLLSGVIGFMYLNETGEEKFNKSRFWLQKAVADLDLVSGLAFQMNLLDFYFRSRNQAVKAKIEEHIADLENKASTVQEAGLSGLLNAAVLDLKARALIFKFAMYDDNQVKIEENLAFIRDIENNVDYDGKDSPVFTRAYLKAEFARYYQKLTLVNLDQEDTEDLLALANENLRAAGAYARKINDVALQSYLKLIWLSVASHKHAGTTEKEIREAVTVFKKSDNFLSVLQAVEAHSSYFVGAGQSQKAYEVLLDLLKMGIKRVEEGGFYLVGHSFRLINNILVTEVRRPGVSWVVGELKNFFNRIQEVIEHVEDWSDYIGREQFDLFRNEYIRLEEPSNNNIVVFYRYQFFSMHVMRLGAIMSGDELGAKMAAQQISKFEDPTNPLTFITASWDEFKDVPNSVRNSTINKCISITKGDLPAAADHLDFSYRNLRSYITFEEVNRLGNFLDERRTNNRQLELGIRLMFHDLYKSGTIFEVVFDMPKFLVDFAKTGFSSQDLEEALDIKGTTAKKYIKIMMEINMIKHEKSVGRKHFYKLRKDNVMNRLGKEQNVLVS